MRVDIEVISTVTSAAFLIVQIHPEGLKYGGLADKPWLKQDS